MNTLKILLNAALSASLSLAVSAAHAADAPGDPAAVRHVLMTQFDKPESRLQVEPVVIAGDAAVASWAQGDRGGRALLFRHGAGWQIAVCAGDALKEAKVLREAGVKAGDADAMARSLAAAEARLSAAQRAKFSSFDGLLRMDAAGQHPPAHSHPK
jgi:hypothetical protein